jgi:hypothetical protein
MRLLEQAELSSPPAHILLALQASKPDLDLLFEWAAQRRATEQIALDQRLERHSQTWSLSRGPNGLGLFDMPDRCRGSFVLAVAPPITCLLDGPRRWRGLERHSQYCPFVGGWLTWCAE